MISFPSLSEQDASPPLAKFSARFGIIERADPVLPVTLRNLEARVKTRMLDVTAEKGLIQSIKGMVSTVDADTDIIQWLWKVNLAKRKKSILKGESGASSFEVPKPGGERAFEVVGIPLKKPGLSIVEMESTILGESLFGESRPLYVPTAVLVTNLSAHFKWGRESSLVWVTTLDKGEPVPDASVTIRNCKGDIVAQVITPYHGGA